MITVEYPPGSSTQYIATTHMRLFMSEGSIVMQVGAEEATLTLVRPSTKARMMSTSLGGT
jgi:hypothetical protein